MTYDEIMPVRVGKIEGKLTGQQIRINWSSAPQEIAYKCYVIHTLRKQLQAANSHPAYSPWTAPAQLMSSGNGQYEAVVMPQDSSSHLKDTEIESVWTAYRIGP
jgi:hypothetical protein